MHVGPLPDLLLPLGNGNRLTGRSSLRDERAMIQTRQLFAGLLKDTHPRR